ncbi:MAG: phosphoribosyltransferase family protein [Microgenomates group bacterium]|nr:phosphoribosyltransferase family protein [Microgenomates group bacterium]
MIFKDRIDAGEKLAQLLKTNSYIKRRLKRGVVVSLLRGGAIVGDIITRQLKIPHLFLPTIKISSPENPELAIGALCFNKIYWEKKFPSYFDFYPSKNIINHQLKIAKEKFSLYLKKFKLEESVFNQIVGQNIILVDDGIATGATVKAAFLFLKTKKPSSIVLASPVAPVDFDNPGFDKVFVFHYDQNLAAVSQFYESFLPVEDQEIYSIIDRSSSEAITRKPT